MMAIQGSMLLRRSMAHLVEPCREVCICVSVAPKSELSLKAETEVADVALRAAAVMPWCLASICCLSFQRLEFEYLNLGEQSTCAQYED